MIFDLLQKTIHKAHPTFDFFTFYATIKAKVKINKTRSKDFIFTNTLPYTKERKEFLPLCKDFLCG